MRNFLISTHTKSWSKAKPQTLFLNVELLFELKKLFWSERRKERLFIYLIRLDSQKLDPFFMKRTFGSFLCFELKPCFLCPIILFSSVCVPLLKLIEHQYLYKCFLNIFKEKNMGVATLLTVVIDTKIVSSKLWRCCFYMKQGCTIVVWHTS